MGNSVGIKMEKSLSVFVFLLLLALGACDMSAPDSPRQRVSGAPDAKAEKSKSQQQATFQLKLVLDEAGDNAEYKPIMTETEMEESKRDWVYVQKTPLLDHQAIKSVSTERSPLNGRLEIRVSFTSEGAKQLEVISRKNIRKRLAIVVDNKIISAQTVQSPLNGGVMLIAGYFSEQEVTRMAATINAGLAR
jgi:preprotein translocase subunit SecD